MASLHIAQIIGTKNKENNEIVWSNSSSIVKYFLVNINNGTLKINVRGEGDISEADTCKIVYLSVQGVPGTQITLNQQNTPFKIGRTGIIEFDVYKHKMIDNVQIGINDLYQAVDEDYYSYNNKCIVDIVYQIGSGLAEAFTNTEQGEAQYNG